MPGSHADDILGEYFESEEWGAVVDDDDADGELDPPRQSPPQSLG